MTGDADSKLYWYQQVREDRLYVEELYENGAEHTYGTECGRSLAPETGYDHRQDDGKFGFRGARENILPGKYLCYMQYTDGNSDESSSHRYYVSIIKAEASVLEEPSNPVRNGYQFGGWWHFDEINETAPPSEKCIWKMFCQIRKSVFLWRRLCIP